MRKFLTAAGGRKLLGFLLTLSAGAAWVLTGHELTWPSVTFLLGLYGAYVGGNAASHVSAALTARVVAPGGSGDA